MVRSGPCLSFCRRLSPAAHRRWDELRSCANLHGVGRALLLETEYSPSRLLPVGRVGRFVSIRWNISFIQRLGMCPDAQWPEL